MKPLSTKLSILALGTVLATGLLSLPSSAHTDPVKHHKGKPAETMSKKVEIETNGLNPEGISAGSENALVAIKKLLEGLDADQLESLDVDQDVSDDNPDAKKRVQIRILRKGEDANDDPRERIDALLDSMGLEDVQVHLNVEVDDTASLSKGDADKKWDVTNPPGKKREIEINTDTGTWMSLDVSPDGKMIAFDLLGDIYKVPMSGGQAMPIASGMAWEIQPRFSPDGEHIAFTSDRAGGDNIWIMHSDGSDKAQVTDESFRLLNNPTWSPDGRFIAARKHFTTSRSLGTGEIWLYSTEGGSGIQLTKKPSESHQKEIGEPIFSPDGRYVYYSANTTRGATFEYAQDSNGQLFEILAYDTQTGKTKTIISGAGGAVRPTPSPDGKTIAFVRRERAQSKLYIHDIASGKASKVYDDLDQDMQETWAVHGVYPNMDFTPDGSHLVFWAGGKIRKLNMKSGKVSTIEFSVNDSRTIIDPPRPRIEVAPEVFDTKMTKFTTASPDGQRVVFESLGKLYVKPITGGAAQRLTSLPDTMIEAYPSFSADGKRITFTTWNDADLAAVHSISASGGSLKTHTTEPGHYKRPVFSPNGKTIVFEKASGSRITSGLWSSDTGIYSVSVKGGQPEMITPSGSHPHFGQSNDRIFLTKSEGGSRALVSVDMGGEKARTHATSKLAQSFFMAPDERHITYRENYNLYVMPTLFGAGTISAGPGGNAVPITKVSTNGATYPSWSGGGKTLHWSIGPNAHSLDIETALTAESIEDMDITTTALSMEVTTDVPSSVIALTGARIITMSDNEGGVIEDGVIVIDGNRIAAIGAAEDVDIPADAKTVDVEGKTIIPGLIDAHAHGPQGVDGVIPQQNWNSIAHLALGVTTIHDPSSRASNIFAAAEMQRAGKIIAPRIFSTGEVIYGAKAPGFFASITSADDAREHVLRLQSQGAYSVKNYNQPRRDQRQQVVTAAREANMAVVAEGGSLFHMDLSMVADGNTSIEHNLPQSELYDDVIQFYGQSKVAYTPTLMVTYGGVRGEDYYYQVDEVWKHPILSNHVPADVLHPRAVRRQMAPEEDYSDAVSAATAKKLMDAGVLVNIGAHGQREGLASHWEMRSFVRGGMSPVEALRTATMNPAKFLGYDDDLGSLEVGKLADLVILSDNPLDDIANSDSVEHVMQNGRLYEADTMNEVVSAERERMPYYFED